MPIGHVFLMLRNARGGLLDRLLVLLIYADDWRARQPGTDPVLKTEVVMREMDIGIIQNFSAGMRYMQVSGHRQTRVVVGCET